MEFKFGETLPKLVKKSAERWSDVPCQLTKTKTGDVRQVNYHDMFQGALDFAGGLLQLGVKRGDIVALIADNRQEWEVADTGLLAIGAIDTPRGQDATEADLSYILSFSEVHTAIAENEAQVKKLLRIKAAVPTLERLIHFDTLSDDTKAACTACGVEAMGFRDVQREGRQWRRGHPDVVESELAAGSSSDLATIIFTSGTTGTPKGVMLSHANILYQLDEITERVFLNPGERALVTLPVWHAYQRAMEYVILAQGGTLCFGKPISRILMQDLATLSPCLLPTVPRVWSAIYDYIMRQVKKRGKLHEMLFAFFVRTSELWCAIDRKLLRKNTRFGRDWVGLWWPVLVWPWLLLWPVKLLGRATLLGKVRSMMGKNFRAGLSGGGSLPEAVDSFFWALGLPIQEVYGLTETSPVVSTRPYACPVFRNVGTPLRGFRVRVVDDEGLILGACQKGNLQVAGGCIMQGYYKRPELTARTMTADGWLDTGDIAVLSVDGEIQIRGRKKDTIVLQGGENIEPLPIEARINESPYITSSVVFGTNDKGIDQKYLVALILPNKEAIESFAAENGVTAPTYEQLVEQQAVRKLLEAQVAGAVSAKNGFKSYERINKIDVITKPFEIGVELSAKQEMMRYRVAELYKGKLAQLYREG